jgi:hypothetical protein
MHSIAAPISSRSPRHRRVTRDRFERRQWIGGFVGGVLIAPLCFVLEIAAGHG